MGVVVITQNQSRPEVSLRTLKSAEGQDKTRRRGGGGSDAAAGGEAGREEGGRTRKRRRDGGAWGISILIDLWL